MGRGCAGTRYSEWVHAEPTLSRVVNSLRLACAKPPSTDPRSDALLLIFIPLDFRPAALDAAPLFERRFNTWLPLTGHRQDYRFPRSTPNPKSSASTESMNT